MVKVKQSKDKWWWRLLKVIYIIFYIALGLIVFFVLYNSFTSYNSNLLLNNNLSTVSKKINLKHKVTLALSEGYSMYDIRNTIEKVEKVDLPYDLEFIEADKILITSLRDIMFFIIIYVVVLELIKKALTYIIGI